MTTESTSTKWKWCLITSLAMVLLSMIPQIHLWIVRGREWNGAYVIPQGDEPLYSAYVNALIDGRPRKNDPFGGRDSTADKPLSESTFSIQFVPAYAIAMPARVLHISASTAFIVLAAVTAFLASVSIFWIFDRITNDHRLASVGTVFVLCWGGALGTYGLFGTFIDGAIPALPFLRRYEPAAAFPIFFIFQILVFSAFTTGNKRHSRSIAALAGIAFDLLIFSYLYLWTAAAVWLACIGGLWLWLRPLERKKALTVLTILIAIVTPAIVVYVWMLSQRGTALDEQHTLVTTHRPDLFRLSETIALLIMVAVAAGIWRRKLQVNDPRFLCCGALLLLPFVVFNQQILTGRTMQVFHFDVFIINYVILIALVLALSLYKRQIPRRLLIWAGTLSIAWGVFATVLPAKLVFVPSAAARDRLVPVLNRLNELSKVDGSRSNLQTQATTSTLVYSPELAVTVLLPTWTSQGTLLDIGGIECATISREQRKEFFFMHLYYSNVTPERLRIVLNGKYDDPTMEHYAPIVIFGSERTSPVAGVDFTPIQTEEINREVRLYEDYFNSFSRTDMVKRPIAYAVVPAETKFDFSKLDLWYKRDTGERVGDYSLYRLEMRP